MSRANGDLNGLPIAISGASSGIGAATAEACAAAGMPVALLARRASRLEVVAARIRSAGGRAVVVEGDVADPASANRLVKASLAEFGALHAVFANAGYGEEVGTLDQSDEGLRAMLETNFFGSVRLARAAAPYLIGQGGGHILLCSSCLSKIGVPRYAGYCISKAAQDQWARALRIELRGKGVRVSSVHPVGTRTEFFDTARARSTGARFLSRSRQRFMQPPERVARAVVACLRRPRGEVWTSTPMRLALAASVATPETTDRILALMARNRGRLAEAEEHAG